MEDSWRTRELFGKGYGYLLGLFTGSVSFLRHSRMFHPRGVTYRAKVVLQSATLDLPGHALIRFSSAWWKKREWMDVLGIAVRFSRSRDFSAVAQPGDQDLLFATVRSPWVLGLAPLGTRFHDFLANTYYAVSPFAASGDDRLMEFRLVPREKSPEGAHREERLEKAIERGASLTLERRYLENSKRDWQRIAEIEILEPISIDQEALRFSPFRDGAGIHPHGLIQFLRIGAYAFSQGVRPRASTS